MASQRRPRVLIAGIAGASLGTELLKCLISARRYEVYGCDISPYAFGHYDGFQQTFLVNRDRYTDEILAICRDHRIEHVVPGADEPAQLLGAASDRLSASGVQVASNSPELVRRFADKAAIFETLASLGFPTPLTVLARTQDDARRMNFPCIVKPSSGSGGSAFVFLASDESEARSYVRYLSENGRTALLQEYVPLEHGEFTVGVLSYPDGAIASSIAMRRLFDHKLAVLQKGKLGVISSGFSEGLIDAFPEVCAQAEAIASAVGSTGPLNVQGRVSDGKLLAFEINPRFSASAYLRSMAGINEVDLYLQHAITKKRPGRPAMRPGYYLRTLSEKYVDPGRLIRR